MRFVPVLLATAGLLLVAPGSASADVIFDPADADDLAATLAEAYKDQGVCYGWQVTVSDPLAGDSESLGSNFGAGEPVTSGTCEATVEFTASITYTSESSESEDYASYDVSSTPVGVSRTDLDALGIDFGGLTGEDPDIPIGQAVFALPLLAADADLAKPIAAAPATGTTPADAQLTDDPGSDWWRNRGGMVMWAVIMLAAGGVFAWWVLRTDRRRRARRPARQTARQSEPEQPSVVTPAPEETPAQPTTPSPDAAPAKEPATEELPVQEPPAAEPPTEELPAQGPPATEPPTTELPVQEPATTEPPPATREPGQDSGGKAGLRSETEASATGPAEPRPGQEPGQAGEGEVVDPGSETEAAEPAESRPERERAAGPSSGARPSAAVAPPAASASEREPGEQASEGQAAEPRTESSEQSTVEPADREPGSSPEQARPAPSDQKDKE